MNQQQAALATTSHDMLIGLAVVGVVVIMLVWMHARAVHKAGVAAGRAAAQEVARAQAAQVTRRPRSGRKGLLWLAAVGGGALALGAATGHLHLGPAGAKAPAPATPPAPKPVPSVPPQTVHDVTRIIHLIPLTGTQIMWIVIVTVVVVFAWLGQRARTAT